MESKDRHSVVFGQAELILKYLRGELNAAEEKQLNDWLGEDERNKAFLGSLREGTTLEECLNFLSSVDVPAALDRTLSEMKGRASRESLSRSGRESLPSPGRLPLPEDPLPQSDREPLSPTESPSGTGLLFRMGRWKAAAAVILVLVAALALLARKYVWQEPARPGDSIAGQQADVSPGSDKATLLLADGSLIALEDSGVGTVREANGIRIRQQDGEVIYEVTESKAAGSENRNNPEEWNTISTPLGGQFQLHLPDGSKVWLNAGSDLRFPAAFTGTLREVELKGEAYFEVARNEKKPFHVKVNGLTVEVLGTHFNVKAYEDEPVVQTTLVEGRVNVRTPAGEELLSPGKQASMDKREGTLKVSDVRTADVIAWKNGLFRFSDESVDEVMRRIGRWYNVEVIYGEIRPETRFSGMISRQVPLSQVLEMLEMTGGARFRTDGRSVTVFQ